MNARQVLLVIKNMPVESFVFDLFPMAEIKQLMNAWELTYPKFEDPKKEAPEGALDQKRWIWECCYFNMTKLVSNFGKMLPINLFPTLIKYNLIFPDGTSNWIAIKKKEEAEREYYEQRSKDSSY